VKHIGSLTHFITDVWQRNAEDRIHILKPQKNKRLEKVTQRGTLVFEPFVSNIIGVNRSRKMRWAGFVLRKRATSNIILKRARVDERVTEVLVSASSSL
jgi:hypothetical protein